MPSPDHPLGVRRSPEGEMHGGDTGAKVQKCKGETRGHVGTVTWGHALARGDMLARGHGDKGR